MNPLELQVLAILSRVDGEPQVAAGEPLPVRLESPKTQAPKRPRPRTRSGRQSDLRPSV